MNVRQLLTNLLVGLALAAGLSEAAVRWLQVPPRVVTIDLKRERIVPYSSHGHQAWIDDWEGHGPEALTLSRRINLACREQPAHRVMILGDSIFHGIELRAQASLGPALERALAARTPDPWCVVNFAQPGSTFDPQLAFFEDWFEPVKPEVVVIELWWGSPWVPTAVGHRLYYFDPYVVDANGLPAMPLVPTTLHRWLFERSLAWDRTTQALAPRQPGGDVPDFAGLVRDRLGPTVARIRQAGARPLIWIAAPLDRPFESLVATPLDWFDPVLTWAAENGITVYREEAALLGHPPEAVRIDPCCHLNEAGTRLVAQALAGLILQDTP